MKKEMKPIVKSYFSRGKNKCPFPGCSSMRGSKGRDRETGEQKYRSLCSRHWKEGYRSEDGIIISGAD